MQLINDSEPAYDNLIRPLNSLSLLGIVKDLWEWRDKVTLVVDELKSLGLSLMIFVIIAVIAFPHLVSSRQVLLLRFRSIERQVWAGLSSTSHQVIPPASTGSERIQNSKLVTGRWVEHKCRFIMNSLPGWRLCLW